MQQNDLDSLLTKLPAEITPERDLWPEITQQLSKPPSKRARLWLSAVAASLIVAVLFWQSFNPEPVIHLAQLEQQYQQQLQQRLAAMTAVNTAYGDWQWQLSIWQDAINQVHLVLRLYPEDSFLQQKLLTLYQQQLDYLSNLTELPNVSLQP
ncbi:hypothetical protein ACO1PK_05175 [Alishewanella sp. d11]|uniref:hypothetical protein n=1 Tax=Alishewanella sp. d11 TaxID=3414030 RepID=UPI003BF89067